MSDLAQRHCIPCHGGVAPLTGESIASLRRDLHPNWEVENNHHLAREFAFRNFAEALAFVNRVGALAEAEGHHPDIYLAWGKVVITLWTHAIEGLAESDFILAAKIDALPPL